MPVRPPGHPPASGSRSASSACRWARRLGIGCCGGGSQQRSGLASSERLGWPSLLPGRRPDKSRHVPADQIIGLRVADGPDEAVVRDLQRPGRHPAAQLSQCHPHIGGRELAELLAADQVHQWLDRVAAELGCPLRPTGQPVREPLFHRGPHRVARRRCHPDVKVGVQRLQLLPDLRLSLAPDLAARPAAVAAEVERDRPDVTVLGRVEVDRVLTPRPGACRVPLSRPELSP